MTLALDALQPRIGFRNGALWSERSASALRWARFVCCQRRSAATSDFARKHALICMPRFELYFAPGGHRGEAKVISWMSFIAAIVHPARRCGAGP
jgi:hypothetical protein